MGCVSSKTAAESPSPPARVASPDLDPNYCPAYYVSGNAGVASVQTRVLETILGTTAKTPSDGEDAEMEDPTISVGCASVEDTDNSTDSQLRLNVDSKPRVPQSHLCQVASTEADKSVVRSKANTDTAMPSDDLSYVFGTLLGTGPRAYQPGQRFNAVREIDYLTSRMHVAAAHSFEPTMQVSGAHTIPEAKEVDVAQGLCDICQSADLVQRKSTRNGDKWEPPTIDLGFIDEIFLTDKCALCRLVSKTLEQSWTSVPMRTIEGFRTRCFIPNNYSASAQDSFTRQFWELNIMISAGSGTLSPHHRLMFQAAVRLDYRHTRSIDAPEGVMQLAKAIDSEQCDPKYIQSVLRRCKNQHCSFMNKLRTEKTCDRPRGYIPDEERTTDPSGIDQANFRVIDVAEKCIIETSRDSSFVALSYTWGPAPFLRLLKGNIHTLCSRNGLSAFDIPKTITDAMETTLILGERFLWVDALCIVQDDPVDIAAQIGRMDQVYSNAVCTIVAASGLDAHAGLAGIHRGPRDAPQHSENVKGLLLHSMGPTLEQTLHESTWWSRGWTYQEFCLSRRLLIFTPSRVFFSCASDHDSEDVVHEDSTAKNAFLAAGGPFQGSRSDSSGDLRTRLTSRAFDLEDPVKTYKILVRDYSARNLSHDSDILNGVQGILHLLTLRTQRSYYVAGLPEHRLETALMWFPVGPLTRRGQTRSGHPYPSWSWAGWKGGVAYEDFDFIAVMTQEVSDWTLETADSRSIDLLVDQIPFSKLLNSKRPAAEIVHREKQRKDLYTLYESGILRFSTQMAEFVVDLSPAAIRGYWPGNHGTKVFPVLVTEPASSQSIAGCILLSLEDAAALVRNQTLGGNCGGGKLRAAFILVSSTQRPWSFTSTGNDSLAIYNEEIYEYRGGSVLDLEVKRFVCNVLWVKEGAEGTYERVAAGQIHVDAWEACRQGVSDVKLA